jgi:prepilin-type N-terminal cleavage/methylation domain-containing protein
MTTPARINSPLFGRDLKSQLGYTLFEILLALGIVAVLLGITVPMLMNSFGTSESERVTQEIEKVVQAAHLGSQDKGEPLRLQILDNGISGGKQLPSFNLPRDWKLQVRRFTENRFRKPEKLEFWEFNSAGICDPLELRLVNKNASVVLKFDPLTALLIEDDE